MFLILWILVVANTFVALKVLSMGQEYENHQRTNLLEMQVLRSYPRPPESKILGVGTSNLCFKPREDSDDSLTSEKPCHTIHTAFYLLSNLDRMLSQGHIIMRAYKKKVWNLKNKMLSSSHRRKYQTKSTLIVHQLSTI